MKNRKRSNKNQNSRALKQRTQPSANIKSPTLPNYWRVNSRRIGLLCVLYSIAVVLMFSGNRLFSVKRVFEIESRRQIKLDSGLIVKANAINHESEEKLKELKSKLDQPDTSKFSKDIAKVLSLNSTEKSQLDLLADRTGYSDFINHLNIVEAINNAQYAQLELISTQISSTSYDPANAQLMSDVTALQVRQSETIQKAQELTPSQEKRSDIQTTIALIFLFLLIVVGILANWFWEIGWAYLKNPRQRLIKGPHLVIVIRILLSVVAAALTFVPTFNKIEQSTGDSWVPYALAFQNGFFWQAALDAIMRQAAKSDANSQGSPIEKA